MPPSTPREPAVPRECDVVVVAPGQQDAHAFRGRQHEPCVVSVAVPANGLMAGPATDERVLISSGRG